MHPCPQTLGVPPPPQVCGETHAPQLRLCPHPSLIVPQLAPTCAHVVAAHCTPHTFGVPPPPHVDGAMHAPHWSTLPQPSLMDPQLAPACAQVVAMQPPSPH
jgi:hypothetical protein